MKVKNRIKIIDVGEYKDPFCDLRRDTGHYNECQKTGEVCPFSYMEDIKECKDNKGESK